MNERNIEVVGQQLIRLDDRNSVRRKEILREIRILRKDIRADK